VYGLSGVWRQCTWSYQKSPPPSPPLSNYICKMPQAPATLWIPIPPSHPIGVGAVGVFWRFMEMSVCLGSGLSLDISLQGMISPKTTDLSKNQGYTLPCPWWLLGPCVCILGSLGAMYTSPAKIPPSLPSPPCISAACRELFQNSRCLFPHCMWVLYMMWIRFHDLWGNVEGSDL